MDLEVLGVDSMDISNFKPIKYKRIKINTYLINEYGDVYSIPRKRLLTKGVDKDGYYDIALQSNDGKRVTYRIATLVLSSFIGDPPDDMNDATVNHIDGDKGNNHYTNLEWMSRSLNSSIRKKRPKGEKNPSAKLKEIDVYKICELIQEGHHSLTTIANIFDTNKFTISNIKRRKTWTHISNNYSF
jgi:hypothetical protein